VSGNEAGFDSGLGEHAGGSDGNGENGGLGDFGQAKLIVWAFKAELTEVVSEGVICLLKGTAGDKVIESEFLAHSGGLGALAWEEQCESGNSCHEGSAKNLIRRVR
jgi:hypothetical protein